NYHGDRPRRIGLRPRDARHDRQCGSARCQMQKISAGEFHFEPPFTSFDYLVGAGEHHRRPFPAKRLRHDQVNDEVELGRLLDPKIGGLRPPQNLSTKSGAPVLRKSMKITVPTGVENSYFS